MPGIESKPPELLLYIHTHNGTLHDRDECEITRSLALIRHCERKIKIDKAEPGTFRFPKFFFSIKPCAHVATMQLGCPQFRQKHWVCYASSGFGSLELLPQAEIRNRLQMFGKF